MLLGWPKAPKAPDIDIGWTRRAHAAGAGIRGNEILTIAL
jgi:hypothetical protein